jgi:hypothetical protein
VGISGNDVDSYKKEGEVQAYKKRSSKCRKGMDYWENGCPPESIAESGFKNQVLHQL